MMPARQRRAARPALGQAVLCRPAPGAGQKPGKFWQLLYRKPPSSSGSGLSLLVGSAELF